MEREKNVTERYRRMLEESKTPLAIAQVFIAVQGLRVVPQGMRVDCGREDGEGSTVARHGVQAGGGCAPQCLGAFPFPNILERWGRQN